MGALRGERLLVHVDSRSFWVSPGVAPVSGEPFGRVSVSDRVVVGWAAPSPAWRREAIPGLVDSRRAATMAADRRQAFLTGRAVLGRLMAEVFPGSTAWSLDTASCAECGAGHGPVSVRGVPALASVAYADGLVVAAVAPTGQVTRIGVDVEPTRPDAERAEELARLLGVPTADVTRRWAEAQAVVKASGHGLRLDPGLVRLGPGSARIEGAPTTYLVRDVEGPAGYAISLAWTPGARTLR